MGIAECEEFLKANPSVERLVHGAPMLVSKVGDFGYKRKPDDAFRDKLKEIKKANPRNTIDTYDIGSLIIGGLWLALSIFGSIVFGVNII